MEKIILLNKASDVKEFIAETQKCVGEVAVSSLDGRYRVDGKSILGVFSLDLASYVCVYVEKEDEAEKIFEKFSKNA